MTVLLSIYWNQVLQVGLFEYLLNKGTAGSYFVRKSSLPQNYPATV